MIAFTTVNISTDDPQPESEPESLAGSLSEPELTQEPQVMQLRAAAKEYLPASQLVHEAADVPADPLYLPATQLMQLLAAAPEYFPAPQLMQVRAVAAEYLPASQLMHEATDEAADVPPDVPA